MDAALKHIRDGSVRELGCSMLLVEDSLGVFGGRVIFQQLCDRYMEAVAGHRAQASHVFMAALERAPSVPEAVRHVVKIVDMHRHMPCWTTNRGEGRAGRSLHDLEAMMLQTLDEGCTGQGAKDSSPDSGAVVKRGVIIDSLSQLLLLYPAQEVLCFLDRLSSHPQVSSVIALVHRDLHEPHVLAGIESICSCRVPLEALGRLQLEAAARHSPYGAPHGLLSFRYKRRTGRVKAETFIYAVMTSGSIHMASVPPNLISDITAEALISLSVRNDGAAGSVSASSSLGGSGAIGVKAASESTLIAGGMKMGLNEQERAAKEQVRLPYEHRGEGKQYQTDDFRTYLPRPAGGHAGREHAQDVAEQQVQRLGQIMYIRDSDEEHDSDEDPDDDLDI